MRKADVQRVLGALRDLYPEATCELNYNSTVNLLVAVVLSAQCTDAMVNRVTESLFAECKTACDYAALSVSEIEEKIRRIGLYRNKAKNIKALAEQLILQHGGEVPASREELTALPGVGRKTANVVLAEAFGVPAIAVDTHVERLSNRIGLVSSTAKTPLQIEEALMKAIPREDWIFAHHGLIWHGRRTCAARQPACERCPLAEGLCRYARKAKGAVRKQDAKSASTTRGEHR